MSVSFWGKPAWIELERGESELKSDRPNESRQLRELARLYGVQTSYLSRRGARHATSPESVFCVLQAMGAPIRNFSDLRGALRERRQSLAEPFLQPVALAWEGNPNPLKLRLPASTKSESLACELQLETGEVQRWVSRLGRLSTHETDEIEGICYVTRKLNLPGKLPLGYHRLIIEVRGRKAEVRIIAAPRHAFTPGVTHTRRIWGVFLPLYALHSQKSWGSGDFSDLHALSDWVANQGGSLVGTLPLLPTFLDELSTNELFDPSPYAPVSRLFWNEFYIDVTRLPELQACRKAQDLVASPAFQGEIRALQASSLVDYRRSMALKRKVLEELARSFFAGRSERYIEFQNYLKARPGLGDYARFRAACERQRTRWREWPRRMRSGNIRAGDFDLDSERYHLFAQWQAQEQLQSVSDSGRMDGTGLYLDFPLGVHPDGFDVWREQDVFALKANGGAPPDSFFPNGQDWGFPPLHPQRIREQGYRYFIACLRHHLRHAKFLRIDHVMGLHRLFWIPQGCEPREGIYVHYPAEEFYAILALESERHRALLVGEDLGTVPPYVRPAMRRHHLYQSYVVQYELTPNKRRPLPPVPSRSLASLNTHDMSPFQAFWKGADIQDRLKLGLLDEAGLRRERRARRALKQALVGFLRHKRRLRGKSPKAATVLRACLAHLASDSRAPVMVSLEDLWSELQPQNVPGTRDERPNWRRKARFSIETFSRMPSVLKLLREVRRSRP